MVANIRLGSIALVICAAASCAPTAKLEPVDVSATTATGIGSPFVYLDDGEPTDVEPPRLNNLTLHEAVKLTLRHSPKIQSAIARVRQAQAEAHQQRLLPNPVMNVSFRLPEAGGPGIVDLSLSAQVLALIQKPGMIAAADHNLRAAASQALIVVLDEVTEVRKEYSRTQSLDARITIAHSLRGLLDDLAEVARSRVDAGEAPQLDSLTIDAERATVATDLIELQTEQRQSRLNLAKAIGAPSSAASWNLESWESPIYQNVGVADWITIALRNRPEIQAQTWRLAALGEQVKLTWLSPFDGTEAGATAERDGQWSVGPAVTLPIPLFDLGQAKKELVLAQRIEARHDMTEARRSLVKEVRQAAESLAATKEALRSVQDRLIPLQEARREQAQNAYRLGFADVTSVRLAERDLQTAKSRLIAFQQKVSEANADLERAVGGIGVASVISTTRPTTASTK